MITGSEGKPWGTGGRIRRITAGAVVALALLSGAAARAQEPLIAGVEPPITTTELQSLSCLGTGSVSAAWATVIVLLSPLEALSAPLVAAAFAAGCGVGAVAAPGVYWIKRHLNGESDDAPAR